MIRSATAIAIAPVALLGACALQPAYQRPALDLPASWNGAPAALSHSESPGREGWWSLLGDSAVDQLVMAGLSDNPTLAEAAARVDQARAALGIQTAQGVPGVVVNGSAARSQDRNPTGNGTMRQSTGGIGATLSWELDLWGRIRESRIAARSRLTARTADAESARLSVVGDIADTALALRACNLILQIRDRDIASRNTELAIFRTRLVFGNVAPVTVAAAQSNLAAARTQRVAQEESCRRLVNALVALTGLDAPAIANLLPPLAEEALPEPPSFVPALPATILLAHPAIVAAEREVAARWSEIAVARAERLPRIDLTAALTGQWIRALGSSDSFVSSSVGAGLTAPLFDGGAGAAKVRANEAAYREAEARLVLTVRGVIRDIEDALAAQQSAVARQETSREALVAARYTLRANDARLRAGSIAQLELEEARRQFNGAQESAIVTIADKARAWVSLIRRTGPSGDTSSVASRAAYTPLVVPDLAGGNAGR
jgi:NodT family efflux transporter outer membrane factor (OMF) lipoprotein